VPLVRLKTALGALGERPFRLLWLGQTLSAAGDSLVGVALAFAVLELGDARDLGFVLASFMLPRALLTLAGGVWADRLPRRLVMIGADLVRAGAQATAAVVLISGAAEVWHLAVTSAVAGAASAFFGPAAGGLVPETVSAARLQDANALIGISRKGVEVLGPLTAGVAVAAGGAGWVLAADAVSYLASVAFLLALPRTARRAPVRSGFVTDLVHGFREVRSRTWLWSGFLVFSVGNMAVAITFVLAPAVAKEELGGAAAWGVIMSGGAVGATIGGALALRLRPVHPLVVSFPVMCLLGLLMLSFVPPLPLPAIAAAAAGGFAAIGLANALWETTMQEQVPREALSRVVAYDWLVSFVFMPLGYVLAGPLAHTFGLGTTFTGCAAVLVTVNLVVLLVPSVRSLRRPAPRAEPASVLRAA
jgi:MFS family permease